MFLKEARVFVLTHTVIVAAPDTVIFEKSLLLLLITLPVAFVATLVNKVIAPLDAVLVLVKVPTIELSSTTWLPVAGTITELDINMMAPVVFTLILVKVFELINCDKVAALFKI